MFRKFFLLFFSCMTLSITVTAQNETQMSPAEYNKKKDSLLVLKRSLLSEKGRLKSEIDSLTNLLTEIKEKNENRKREYFIKKYGKEDGLRVYLGQIWKGMTEEMMLDSWGKPDKKDVNKQSYGTYTQFYYGDIIYFFKNGILFEWEEAE